MQKTVLLLVATLTLLGCNLKKQTITINDLQYTIDGSMDKGIAKCYFKDGSIQSTTELSGGMLNGKFEFFYDNHKLKKYYYHKDGQIHGPYKMYYKDGSLFEEGSFANGYKAGTTMQYNPNGTKLAEIKYSGKDMESITEYRLGKAYTYKLAVSKEKMPMQSSTIYSFKVTPEPRLVKYYIEQNGKNYLIEGNSYRTIQHMPGKIKFTAKGITDYGNGFMLAAEK